MKHLIYYVLIMSLLLTSQVWARNNSDKESESVTERLVKRHLFTSNIQSHEPVDLLLALANSETEVYFYTDLRHFEGQRVIHRWQRGDEILAEIAFTVEGPRWRVWSKKQLLPSWTGTIRVSVLDADKRVVASSELNYINSTDSP